MIAFSRDVLQRLIWIWLPVPLLLGAAVWLWHQQNLAGELTSRRQEAAYTVRLQTEIASKEFESIKTDLLYLAEDASLKHFFAGGDIRRRELEERYLLFAAKKDLYDQIRFLDHSGREIVRVNHRHGRPHVVPVDELQLKQSRYYFEETLGLDRGEVHVSAFDLNIEHGGIEQPWKPVIRFSTPVFDVDGRKQGVMVLNYRGARLIEKLKEVALRSSGSVMILNPDGFWISGPQPEDEWGFVSGVDRTFARKHADAWARISRPTEGQFLNAEGLFTFHKVVRSVPNRADAGEGGGDLLTVLSYIPMDVLYATSRTLLAKFLAAYVIVVIIYSVFGWYLAYSSMVRKRDRQQLKESETRLRTLSTQLITAQEEERKSISRDLHDDLGQVATAISLDLERAAQRDNGESGELIDRAFQGAQRLLEKVHDISSRLRPSVLDDLGLKDAVESYVGEFESETGIDVQIVLKFERLDIPSVVGESIFRVLQESLANVFEHADTKQVFVRVEVSENVAELTVRDEGVGFQTDSTKQRSLGILGMRERAELLGGVFNLNSELGSGTDVYVRIPIVDA